MPEDSQERHAEAVGETTDDDERSVNEALASATPAVSNYDTDPPDVITMNGHRYRRIRGGFPRIEIATVGLGTAPDDVTFSVTHQDPEKLPGISETLWKFARAVSDMPIPSAILGEFTDEVLKAMWPEWRDRSADPDDTMVDAEIRPSVTFYAYPQVLVEDGHPVPATVDLICEVEPYGAEHPDIYTDSLTLPQAAAFAWLLLDAIGQASQPRPEPGMPHRLPTPERCLLRPDLDGEDWTATHLGMLLHAAAELVDNYSDPGIVPSAFPMIGRLVDARNWGELAMGIR